MISYIIWNAAPQIFPNGLFGWEPGIRWYGLLFALGFLISQQVMFFIHKKEGKPEKDVETLTIYLVIATILGARLGHVLFYEPQNYFPNVLDVFKIWEGGLASHGAAVGILFALWVYSNYEIKWVSGWFKSKKKKRVNQSWLQVVDRIVIVVALTGCLIRFGNFMNSEIIGKPTTAGIGVVFTRPVTEIMNGHNVKVRHIDYRVDESKSITDLGYLPMSIYLEFGRGETEEKIRPFLENRVHHNLATWTPVRDHVIHPLDQPLDYTLIQNENGTYGAKLNILVIPRHAAQLYESLSSLLIFVILFLYWYRNYNNIPPGRIFGIFLIVLFGLRFFYEFLKENQVRFEDAIPLNMGQWLSVPLVIIGVFILVRSYRSNPVS